MGDSNNVRRKTKGNKGSQSKLEQLHELQQYAENYENLIGGNLLKIDEDR